MSMQQDKLKNILQAALMSIARPMTLEHMMKLFVDEERPSLTRVKDALTSLQAESENSGIELKEIASGYRYQARQDYSQWLSRLWEERPPRYSRAYLETLALIAYRQPVTRAEIEEVRGVSVSSSIVKTMLEREWIRVVGHRDVPGRPSLYATTKQFLDYFNMKSLDELPSLAEIRDLEELSPELGLTEPGQEDESQISEENSDKALNEISDIEELNDKDLSEKDKLLAATEEFKQATTTETHEENSALGEAADEGTFEETAFDKSDFDEANAENDLDQQAEDEYQAEMDAIASKEEVTDVSSDDENKAG